jgi:hypothetical protein
MINCIDCEIEDIFDLNLDIDPDMLIIEELMKRIILKED